MTLLLALFLALPAAASPKETKLVLLETSMEPLTLDECQRARPDLGRPHRVISKQARSNEPWFARTCVYLEQR